MYSVCGVRFLLHFTPFQNYLQSELLANRQCCARACNKHIAELCLLFTDLTEMVCQIFNPFFSYYLLTQQHLT